MVNIRKIRVGTKFLVTYAIPESGMKKGQIVKVDSKRFGIPGINGYLINRDLGFDGSLYVRLRALLQLLNESLIIATAQSRRLKRQ